MIKALRSGFPGFIATTVVVVLVIITGCAGGAQDASLPPTVEVDRIESMVITPEVIKFEAQILIRNRMRESLEFERVDYAVDLFDTELFAESWDGLKMTKGGGRQTVTFPFQIAMKDIAAQAIDLLAEGSMRIAFRGTVHPDSSSGVEPLPFQDSVTIPIPAIPTVSLSGAQGNPFGESFRVLLDVRNPNGFSLSVGSIDSYLEINRRRYPLLHTVRSSEIGPEETGVVELQMDNSVGKSLSMVLSTLQSPQPEFRVGGTIVARTPYGWIYIPVGVEGTTP